jgi:hypothetical protein
MIQQTLGIVIMPAKQEGIALFLNKTGIALTTTLVDAAIYDSFDEAQDEANKANRLWGGANDLSPFGLSAASFTRLIAKEGNE